MKGKNNSNSNNTRDAKKLICMIIIFKRLYNPSNGEKFTLTKSSPNFLVLNKSNATHTYDCGEVSSSSYLPHKKALSPTFVFLLNKIF